MKGNAKIRDLGNLIEKNFSLDPTESYDYEKEALQKLSKSELKLFPELVSFNDVNKIIIMTKINFPPLEIETYESILSDDKEIIKYAKARYNLRMELSKCEVCYYDWKNDHLRYDIEKGILYLIDFDGDKPSYGESVDNIEGEFEFLKGIDDGTYKNCNSYLKFVEKMKSEMWDE